MQVWRFLCHDGGGLSPHTASASLSALTTSPTLIASAARTSASRGPIRAAESSTVSGPRTEMPTPSRCARCCPPSTHDVPIEYRSVPPGPTRVPIMERHVAGLDLAGLVDE